MGQHPRRRTGDAKGRLAAVKSLLTFATRIGYIPFDPGAVVRLPPAINVLAKRILSGKQVVRLIALARGPRNHALLRLLYLAALRASCGHRR